VLALQTGSDVQTIRSAAEARAVWRMASVDGSAPALAYAPEWFDVIREAYGHEPLYLSVQDDDGRTAMLPSFIVRRPWLGTVVSSMPFLDTGGPCGRSAWLTARLIGRLVEQAGRAGARAVELRCTAPIETGATAQQHKVGMVLPLPSADVLWKRLDKTVRNQVRKAERSGLTLESGGVDLLADFYDVFASRMRDLGSPVHGLPFLRSVLLQFGERARIILACKERVAVGGLVTIAVGERLAVPWAACLQQYFSLCPNMLLYWEALRHACDAGFTQFDFGRSTRDAGTYRFKRQWGAQEEPLFWYTIPLRQRAGTTPDGAGRRESLAVEAWRRLPLAVTRSVGPRIRRYLTQ
jgi:FemAB-related protein (PEP-CTERM system-associated)